LKFTDEFIDCSYYNERAEEKNQRKDCVKIVKGNSRKPTLRSLELEWRKFALMAKIDEGGYVGHRGVRSTIGTTFGSNSKSASSFP
jgi:hypothetical protein